MEYLIIARALFLHPVRGIQDSFLNLHCTQPHMSSPIHCGEKLSYESEHSPPHAQILKSFVDRA